MEKTQMTNESQENTGTTAPVKPRKVVRMSTLSLLKPNLLDVESVMDDVVWVCAYEKKALEIHENTNEEVCSVKIINVSGSDNIAYDNLMIVGVHNGHYYKKWCDSGAFPYSRYCSEPGKLHLDTIYGFENLDTLKLIVAKKGDNDNSVSIALYDRSNCSTIFVGGLTVTNKLAQDSFGIDTTINIKEEDSIDKDAVIYAFPMSGIKEDTDYIVDVNLLIDGAIYYGRNNRFILEGGNLYRWYSLASLPPVVICNNGNIICRNTELFKNQGLGHPNNGIFKKLSRGAVTGPHMMQGVFTYEFNVSDFIDTDKDYAAIAASASINATNVLKRIFDAVYEYGDPNGNRFLIRFPENQYCSASYHLTEPLVIPHGVTIDFGGARLLVGAQGESSALVDNKETFFSGSDSKSIISFGYNPIYPILVNAQIRNVEIQLHHITRAMVEKVIDLTYFSGVLENIRISLGGADDIVALWQPYGTPTITYSDMKIIRRCIIENFGWRVNTPTVIFCQGDGCIIEQSILGFVAIIGGNSYTIRGCLNDKYLICDSSVDFTASYWEAGQFEILNSEVSFGCGRLNASNSLRGAADRNKYLGPWFSIDTKDSYARLKKIINDQNLNTENFMEQIENDQNNVKGTVSRIYERPSTVEFKPTLKVQTTFWGYTQPWSDSLFKVEGHPHIYGLENLASVNEIYFDNPDENTNQIWQHSTCAASIPLVNGDFYDWRTSVKVPDNVSINVYKSIPWLSDEPTTPLLIRRAGVEWAEEELFSDFKVIFELDRKRKLYSRPYECDAEVRLANGEMPTINVNVAYQKIEDAPRNLKTILLFKYDDVDCKRLYMARNHFKEVSYATLVNAGTRDLEFAPGYIVNVGEFSFVKRLGLSLGLEETDELGDKYLIAGLELKTPELRKYFNSHEPLVTCRSGQDLDVPDCDGLCYGHACLCDNKGNLVPEVKDCVFMYHGVDYYNVCTRMDVINDINVRAYVEGVPMTGEWVDGDEVVIETEQSVYRYYGDTWHQMI